MSQQSTLGDDPGIAEELAEGQRSISIAEFFEKNKHMLGFDSPARGLVTAVKEGVDNSLDAAEEAGILPDIYVEITEVGDYYQLVIEDNGPGITKEQIPKVFGKLLYGSRFHKREQSLTPDQELLIRENGTVKQLSIGTFCNRYLSDEESDTAVVPDSIEVPAFNRETHTMTWQPVTHAIRHDTSGSTYSLTTESGRTVEVTEDHSLFTITSTGETEEISAAELSAGDPILVPEHLPETAETVDSINILTYLSTESLDSNWYVRGFDAETLERLRASTGAQDHTRAYTHNGVKVSATAFENDFLPNRRLPVDVVLELGWEQRAKRQDCDLVYSEADVSRLSLPVDLPITDASSTLFSNQIAHDRITEDTLQSLSWDAVGLSAEYHPATDGGISAVGSSSSDQVTDLFRTAELLTDLFTALCRSDSGERYLPDFIFDADNTVQQQFLIDLYDLDYSRSIHEPAVFQTDSQTLASQLSVLWNMQGVIAAIESHDDGSDSVYDVRVSENELEQSGVFGPDTSRSQIPITVLDNVRIGDPEFASVPDTIPGLLLGAGVGSSVEEAAQYQAVIEAALGDGEISRSRRVEDLCEFGLLDSSYEPTQRLRDLWESIQQLHGFSESDLSLLTVTEITETEPPEYVYDISVPGETGYDENFVVVNDGAISVKNSRGQQGIGISASVLYAQLTSGKPARVTSRPKGSSDAQYFELIIDTDTNEPEIKKEEPTTWDRPHGTRIEIEMEANMRARKQLHEYIRNTAVVNPHARIELREPGLDEPLKFERGTDQLPSETEEIRPHPHGVELGTLLKMISSTDSRTVSGFLQGEFTRVGRKTAKSIIDGFRDRHFGRELTWTVPGAHEDADIETAVSSATANKGADATAAFAKAVSERIREHDRVAHHDIIAAVDSAADSIAEEYETTFGDTVRENAVEAAWNAITGPEAADNSRRKNDLYRIIDSATSTRKDEATIEGLSRRIAEKFISETNSRDRLTRDELLEYVDRASDMTEKRDDVTVGDTARDNIVNAIWEYTKTVPDDPPTIRELESNRDMVSDLLEGMRETSVLSPPTSCLAPITEELIEAGLRKEFDADFYAAATRDADVHGGDPFIVEAGIAYGGELEDGSVDVLRFANRVPLVYQRGACATTDVVKQIGWRNYNLDQPGGSGLPNGPAVIMIHVASTNVPFTSESKDAVANVPEIEDEIELAVREAARELKSYLKKKRSMQQRRRKQDALVDILPEMAKKVAEVTEKEEPDYSDALAKIMNNLLVERHVSTDDDTAQVALTVENHMSRSEDLEITEMVDSKPTNVPDTATAVEVDGEWFIKWSVTLSPDESATLNYQTDADASFDLSVDGIETAKLIVSE